MQDIEVNFRVKTQKSLLLLGLKRIVWPPHHDEGSRTQFLKPSRKGERQLRVPDKIAESHYIGRPLSQEQPNWMGKLNLALGVSGDAADCERKSIRPKGLGVLASVGKIRKPYAQVSPDLRVNHLYHGVILITDLKRGCPPGAIRKLLSKSCDPVCRIINPNSPTVCQGERNEGA